MKLVNGELEQLSKNLIIKADAQLSYIYFAQVAHNSASALGCSSDDQRPKISILCPEIKKVGKKEKKLKL